MFYIKDEDWNDFDKYFEGMRSIPPKWGVTNFVAPLFYLKRDKFDELREKCLNYLNDEQKEELEIRLSYLNSTEKT